MKCPVDNETLVTATRSGVEIDYCPTCRGVWLDRGELDKIIEHSRSEAALPASDDSLSRPHNDRNHQPQKSGAGDFFLSDIFDF